MVTEFVQPDELLSKTITHLLVGFIEVDSQADG